jgi:hypothetical protein
MVFTLVGPDFFPSAATINLTDDNPGITVVAAGAAPEDGFSGYPPRGNTARWGDYSAAAVSPDGTIWLATEYIPDLPRTSQANWGTFIMRIETWLAQPARGDVAVAWDSLRSGQPQSLMPTSDGAAPAASPGPVASSSTQSPLHVGGLQHSCFAR